MERYGSGGLTAEEGYALSYTRGAVASAVDYKMTKVVGKNTPGGAVADAALTVLSDQDIEKYGMAGAERRVRLDIVGIPVIGILAELTGNPVAGTAVAVEGGRKLDEIKNQVSPELTSEERDEEDKRYIEEVKERII